MTELKHYEIAKLFTYEITELSSVLQAVCASTAASSDKRRLRDKEDSEQQHPVSSFDCDILRRQIRSSSLRPFLLFWNEFCFAVDLIFDILCSHACEEPKVEKLNGRLTLALGLELGTAIAERRSYRLFHGGLAIGRDATG